MSRRAASIQAEIDIIEAHLSSTDSLLQSVGGDGTSLTHTSREQLSKQLDRLYQQLARATGRSPMIVRGEVRGLREA